VYNNRKRQEVFNFLRNVPILERFTFTALKKSVDLFKQHSNPLRGFKLYRQGKPAEHVFLIKSGEFLVTKRIIVNEPNTSAKLNDDLSLTVTNDTQKVIRKYELLIASDMQFLGDEDVDG